MKRKTFIKKVMAKDFGRNEAAYIRDRLNQMKKEKSQTPGKKRKERRLDENT